MKVTRRQEEFITNLIDLSAEFEGPIHYSVLAQRLGVSPFTAYDMLRLLEEKGLVTSEYQLAAGKNGPGRAERLFYPSLSSQKRKEMLVVEFGGRIPGRDEHKEFVMSKIESDEFMDKELATEVLARIPDIEGGELFALPGMIRMLDEVRPLLFIEIHGSEAAKAGWDLLTAQKFQICRMEPNYPPIHTMKEEDWKSYWVGFPDG